MMGTSITHAVYIMWVDPCEVELLNYLARKRTSYKKVANQNVVVSSFRVEGFMHTTKQRLPAWYILTPIYVIGFPPRMNATGGGANTHTHAQPAPRRDPVRVLRTYAPPTRQTTRERGLSAMLD